MLLTRLVSSFLRVGAGERNGRPHGSARALDAHLEGALGGPSGPARSAPIGGGRSLGGPRVRIFEGVAGDGVRILGVLRCITLYNNRV